MRYHYTREKFRQTSRGLNILFAARQKSETKRSRTGEMRRTDPRVHSWFHPLDRESNAWRKRNLIWVQYCSRLQGLRGCQIDDYRQTVTPMNCAEKHWASKLRRTVSPQCAHQQFFFVFNGVQYYIYCFLQMSQIRTLG